MGTATWALGETEAGCCARVVLGLAVDWGVVDWGTVDWGAKLAMVMLDEGLVAGLAVLSVG